MAPLRHPWFLRETRRDWPSMPAYQRSEHGAAFLPALLIALLALSRRFAVLEAGPALVVAPAGATLVLGLADWLPRERDDRHAPDGLEPDGIE